MQELLDQLIRYARGMWRYRWMMMAVTWLVCIIGWAVVLRMPDVYQASARVHVDTQSMLRPLLRGLAVDSGSVERVGLITRTLLSNPNLEQLARMTDLDLRAENPKQMEDLISGLRSKIRIESTRNENLYTISYTDSDRNLAKRVVQSLLTIFVENTLGQSRADTDAAQDFLDRQIAEYEARLRQAEDQLAEFKREHVGMMPGEGQDYYKRLESALAELQNARLQLRELENRLSAQQRQLQDFEEQTSEFTLYGAGESPERTALDTRIRSLEQQLDDLLLRYTNKHPDVIEIQGLIRKLEQERAQIKPPSADSTQQANPVYQQLKIMIGETESQIAGLQVRVNEYEERVAKLREMINTIPQVEAELARLNRDYNVNKANYEELLERREAAKLSKQADISADDVKFRVVDPPRVPIEPSGPPRVMLMSAVLGLAFGIGGGIGFLVYQIRPTFEDARLLKELTGHPVFGSVCMIYTDDYLKKRRLALAGLAVATVGLLCLYGLVVTAEILNLNLLRA